MTDDNKFPKPPNGTKWRVTIERSQREGDWVRVRLVDDTFSRVTIGFKRYRLTRVDCAASTRLWAIAAAEKVLGEYANVEADKTLAEVLTEEANSDD